jgi:hypothetical protein
MNKHVTSAILVGALAAVFLFAGLVYAVLFAAHMSEAAATTVQGPTPRRLWATMVALLALIGVIVGGLALRRSAGRVGAGNGRIAAILALVAGLIALINGALNLAIATSGPGSGNGVVGAAAAVVLGVVAMVLSGLALACLRRTEQHSQSGEGPP